MEDYHITGIYIEGFATADGVRVNNHGAWLGDWNPETESVNVYVDEDLDFIPAPEGWEALKIEEEPARDIYLILGETDHGQRYWRTGNDPDIAMDRNDQRLVLGPALVGPKGYENEEEAAFMLAEDFSLDDPSTWPVDNEKGYDE